MANGELLARVLDKRRAELLSQWSAFLADADTSKGRVTREELSDQADEFLTLLSRAIRGGSGEDWNSPPFADMRAFLEKVSRSRVKQGFSSDETATFIFSFKRPLFAALRAEAGQDGTAFADEVWVATALLDGLGLHTVKSFQRSREEVINRQQQDLLELSTPVVKLWDGVLALPVIGTLDSARTQVVMESLLQQILDTESEIAIIDITGVPMVDTMVAQHLLKTVTALRLMGAECIISGIRPQIAQTIVHLGVDLQGVTTRATLADALALALKRIGHSTTRG